MNRRNFLKYASASATALSIVPSHVLGGPGQVAPNEKLNMALIGCGTQGLREMVGMLAMPEVQVVAVCDPNKDSADYVDWSKDGLRKSIANAIGKPDWRAGVQGIPGGRDVGGEMVPLANRMKEVKLVIETARQTKVATHFIPASSGEQVSIAAQLIRDGAIGNLLEIHNWSNRPVWPQYATLPVDTPPVPKGFEWDLWLGPSLDRPYHPNYTHAVFRGWYEFGGGAIADMGHYSLWNVFREFNLDAPTVVESTPSHVCTLKDQVSVKIKNDYSYPMACTIRFKFAAKGNRPAVDLFWYDGGMKPQTPDELAKDNAELSAEGMMFVGDKGKILAGFLCQNPRIISQKKTSDQLEAKKTNTDWVKAFKGGAPTDGNFLLAGPISEAFNLGAVSLRLGGKRLVWDSSNMKIANLPDANKYLTREYRKGWEL